MPFDVLIVFDAIGNKTTKLQYFGSFSTQKHFRHSDFTYGVRKDHNAKTQRDQLRTVYYLCVPS
jgi:hypothetical protein